MWPPSHDFVLLSFRVIPKRTPVLLILGEKKNALGIGPPIPGVYMEAVGVENFSFQGPQAAEPALWKGRRCPSPIT